jgi:hypothetical protein
LPLSDFLAIRLYRLGYILAIHGPKSKDIPGSRESLEQRSTSTCLPEQNFITFAGESFTMPLQDPMLHIFNSLPFKNITCLAKLLTYLLGKFMTSLIEAFSFRGLLQD